MKLSYLFDVPVFLVFFNRPETFKIVFEAVRQARPSKLFLCQDGARKNRDDDLINVENCRKIASNIDWECDVTYDYSSENLGCGMRIFTGITNVFKKVDRVIIIEDDCIPNISFFPFCQDILERYINDQRVKIICGMNHMGIYDGTDDDYFFTESGSIWGWATWKRAWEQVEYDMPYLKNAKLMKTFVDRFDNKFYGKELLRQGLIKKQILDDGGQLSSWSFQHGMSLYLNNQLNIVPKYNMISNIGLTEETTNGSNNIRKIPRGLQCVFNAKTYDVKFPLKHPQYMIEDKYYEKQVNKIMGWTFWRKKTRRLEGLARQIIFAQKGDIKKMINKIRKRRNSK